MLKWPVSVVVDQMVGRNVGPHCHTYPSCYLKVLRRTCLATWLSLRASCPTKTSCVLPQVSHIPDVLHSCLQTIYEWLACSSNSVWGQVSCQQDRYGSLSRSFLQSALSLPSARHVPLSSIGLPSSIFLAPMEVGQSIFSLSFHLTPPPIPRKCLLIFPDVCLF